MRADETATAGDQIVGHAVFALTPEFLCRARSCRRDRTLHGWDREIERRYSASWLGFRAVPAEIVQLFEITAF
jgi:hypothetical protein